MRKWGMNGIRHQVLMLALVPTLTVSILLVAYFTSTRIQDLEQTFHERAEAIALKLAPAGEYGVFSRNQSILQDLAQATLTEHDVQSVTFYTENGTEIASSGQALYPFKTPFSHSLSTDIFVEDHDRVLSIVVPIIRYKEGAKPYTKFTKLSKMETLIGWLKIEFDNTSIHRREYQILIDTCMILLLGLSMSGLHALQMGRNVTRPILELAQAVGRIKKGDLNIRIRPTVYHEMQILENGINTMAQALHNAHTELQNKVDKATLNLRRSLETIEVQNLELEIARQAAENSSQIKSEFLADMSHEIRTPLNAIVGFLHLLQKTPLSAKQAEYLVTISKSSESLLSIINDILDFSKIEAGKLRIERTRMNIRDCVEETLNLLSPHANEKGLALIPLIYSDVPKECLGDPLRIKQVITNLVSNAIKFTEQGSVIVRVMLEKEEPAHAFIRVNVTDTGIGLSPEEQQELFQAFSQAKIATSRQFGGTGLGLVICKKLVEHMDGNIGLESAPKKGSTFWFTFKVEKVSKPTSPLPPFKGGLTSPLLSFKEGEVNIHPIPLQKGGILAVDDNPENLKLITIFLEEMGYKVTALLSGIEAVEIIKHQSFPLILMDIRMPKMNGIEATHAIRAFETEAGRKPSTIIALTAHALISEREAMLAAGIDDYLIKPISEKALKAILNKWLIQDEGSKQDEDGQQDKGNKVNTVDWDMAKSLAGDKQDLAEELFQKLLTSLPKAQADINQAFECQNYDIMRDAVHKLHGACCYCGVPELKQAVYELEMTLANHNLGHLKHKLAAFNHSIENVLEFAGCFEI